MEEVGPIRGTEFICEYCLQLFRDNKLKCLKDFEKILIQRAKAFQTVANLQTAASTKIPPAARLKKVKGKTFYLPLPLNETLNSLNFSQERIKDQTSLIIIVHYLPTDKDNMETVS